jgi:P-type Cu2+ transporter
MNSDALTVLPKSSALDDAAHTAVQYAVLDDEQEWSSFSKPAATAGHWDSSLLIEGMHCAACSGTIETVLNQVPGVVQAQVNAANQRARVVWDAALTKPSVWLNAITRAGYHALPAQDALGISQRQSANRQALWRWLVAGFCMMQVMMYASPEYFSAPGDVTDEMRHLLRWASWVLTLPVMLFACKPFFANAWNDICRWRIHMDLPVALGMGITFIVSSLGTFEPAGAFGQAVYFDSLTMFVFFLLTGRWLEQGLRSRTAGALERLLNRMPESVERLTPTGLFERVSLRRLKVDDCLRIMVGESFPADGTITSGETTADEALLTGEARPIKKPLGSSVIAGSHNLSATVQMRVSKVGADTRYAQIVALMERASTDKPPLALLADRVAKPFLWGILLVALGAAAYGWSTSPSHAVMVAVAVLIVTCPCALSLATPAAMLAAAGALAKQGIVVRQLHAFEALSKIDTIIFDKTGTLTQTGLSLTRVITRKGVTEQTALALASTIAKHSSHPASLALATIAPNHGAQGLGIEVMNVLALTGQGLHASLRVHTKAQNTTAVTSDYWLGSANFCHATPLNTVGVQVHLSDVLGWVASFELAEQLRSDAAITVHCLQKMGIHVSLLSGDMAPAVAHIAHQLNIDSYQATCTPEQKLLALKNMQQQGLVVAMVGDGINDGPVLAGAHVSFAVGHAAPLTQSKTDFIILSEHISHVLLTVRHARKTMRVVKQNLTWALIYNALCIPLALAGYMPAWLAGLGMAVSSLTVVGNALRLTGVQSSKLNG